MAVDEYETGVYKPTPVKYSVFVAMYDKMEVLYDKVCKAYSEAMSVEHHEVAEQGW